MCRCVSILRAMAVAIAAFMLFVPAHAQQRNLGVAASASGSRVALVIGNDTYSRVPKLNNARADARAIAQSLRQAGFEVILREDLNDKGLREAVRSFKSRISGGSEAVFFFAGHGVQLGAANYLLPVDINADNEEQVKDDGLSLQRVLDDMTEQKARFSLAIVDACRNNPFPKVAGRSIGAGRGLAPTTAATGQMVIYSAGAGQAALDRLNPADRNPNGLFTRVFLQEMERPGLSVDRVLRNVRDQVVALAKSVNHQQVPALYDQAIGEFYFRPGAAGATAAPAPPSAADSAITERAFWDSIKDTKNADELKAYLEQYPNGSFATLARARLKGLEESARPAPPTQVASAAPSTAAIVQAGSIASMPRGTVFRDCTDCPEMVAIPAGSFVMGSPASEPGRRDSEGPQHTVNVARAFAAGKFEVTRAQFARFVQESGRSVEPGCYVWTGSEWKNDVSKSWRDTGFAQTENDPVACVSWNDAKAYVEWLARKTGKRYRLLTEAEWEYVARAGTNTPYSTGANINPSQANYRTDQSFAGSVTAAWRGSTTPVGSFAANAFGLHDVHGNVWEWTEDCWNDNFNGAPTDGSAWAAGDCGRRVLRGGSWSVNPRHLRSADRVRDVTGRRLSLNGFRLARTD